MRLPEQRFWDRARRALVPILHAERIENLVGVGIPDVWFLAHTGLIMPTELKAIQGWPARATTRVLGPKAGLSVDQRNWHLTWKQAGGTSAVLVGVGGDRQYLFHGRLHDEINDFTQQDFYDRCAASTWYEIRFILINGFRQ